MDAFDKLFPTSGRKLLTGSACITALVYCGLVLYGSWIYLSKMHKIGIELEDLPIPAWIAHSMLLFGFLFLTIRLLILHYNIIFRDADGFKRAEEAKESMQNAEELKKE